ncbi:MAG: peptidoglycan-binding protein [Micrococcales bacterium]|nr:peptidoglycan-binding protein [Micrococcales bacterium]
MLVAAGPAAKNEAQAAVLKTPCSTYISAIGFYKQFNVYVPTLSTANSVAARRCILGLGNQGMGVKVLQQTLAVCYGKPLTYDGIFGANTKAAVVYAQKVSSTIQDGIYGPGTHDAIKHIRVGGGACDYDRVWAV